MTRVDLESPHIIPGGLNVDDRGEVSFVNGFKFPGVVRFYWMRNHRVGFVRAWHGHLHETKYVVVTSGSAIVAAVHLSCFETGTTNDKKATRYTLSAHAPAILCIPAGYANGCMALEENTVVMHFGTVPLGSMPDDDVRFSADTFRYLFEVEER